MTKLNGRDAELVEAIVQAVDARFDRLETRVGAVEHLIAELDVPRRPAGFAAPESLQ